MRNRQLALATIAFAVSFALWGLIAALAPHFKDIYHLTATQTSLMIAVPVILGSLFRVPMGILADRFGGRLMFSLLLAFSFLPAAAIALIHSFPATVALGFLLGISGASFAVGVAFTSKWFPAEQQGLALGIFGMGNIGQSVATFFGPRLSTAIGWQNVFYLFGVISVVWAIVFWIFARDAAPGRPVPLAHLVAVFAHRRLSWALAFFYFMTFGGFVALGIYLPTLLKSEFHLSLADAGLKAAGFVLLATIMRPIGGKLADRIGGAQVLVAVFAVLIVLAFLFISTNLAIFTIAALGAAAMLGLGNGAVFRLVPQLFPDEVGVVTGLVGALGGLGGFFPPLVLGILSQATGSYAFGFVLLALFAAAALILNVVLFLRRPSLKAPIGRSSLASR